MKKGAIVGAAVVLAALAMVIAGCGGDGDDTTALTKAQFTKQANALCTKSDEERKAEYRARAENGQEFTDSEQEELFIEVFIQPFQEMVGELEDLGVPQGDEQKLEEIFSEMKKGGKVLEGDPLLILSEPKVFDKANQLSSEYGMTGCVI